MERIFWNILGTDTDGVITALVPYGAQIKEEGPQTEAGDD